MNGGDRNEVPGVVKFGLGVGIGFALYKLLGWAGGFGFGRGAEAAPGASAPARPRDARAVEILVKRSPTDPTKAVIEMDGRIVSVGELIARIDAGGRRDVFVTVAGDTRRGAWTEISDALVFAGIQIFRRQVPRVP